MMHELFFAIARDLPWDSLVQRYLEGLFAGARLLLAAAGRSDGDAPTWRPRSPWRPTCWPTAWTSG